MRIMTPAQVADYADFWRNKPDNKISKFMVGIFGVVRTPLFGEPNNLWQIHKVYFNSIHIGDLLSYPGVDDCWNLLHTAEDENYITKELVNEIHRKAFANNSEIIQS